MKTKKLPVITSQKLIKLAEQIRSTYASTERLVTSAKERNAAAVAEAMLCGKALTEAKELVGHGGWLKWLKKNCKGVHERTAQDYMRLANTKHAADLKPDSIRQALRLLRIIDDYETPPPSDAKPILVMTPGTALEPKQTNSQKKCDKPAMPSWEKKKVDPLPIIKDTVKDLLALLETITKQDAAKLLKPLRAWLK